MRRERIQRAENDSFSRHPERTVRALELHELDFYAYGLLKFFVDKIALPGRNGEILYTLDQLAQALRWPLSHEWLRRRLHDLRDQGWIEFDDLKAGQRRPWVFRLARTAIDGEIDRPPTDLQLETPSELELTSNSSAGPRLSSPPPARPSERSRPPTAETSREEKRREEIFLEGGKYDHVLGKTTEGDAAQFNGEPVQVERRLGGSLAWSGASIEGEEGVLADCQALVDAGFAEWR
jgi:hypothetical protein